MAATERVVVLMSPAKKAALDARAASAGAISTGAIPTGAISTGEFIRRAVGAYGEPALAEAEELRRLHALAAAIRAETPRRLDLDERDLDDMLSCRANGRLGS